MNAENPDHSAMGALTYKCPNCGGELVFDPAEQNYHCPYCQSRFSQQELDEISPAKGETSEENEAEGDVLVYHCPSCGASVATDAATAASFCYYCHNPVVLEGRLSGKYMPDWMIPFRIDRDAATAQFLAFVKKKRFVPKDFFCESQIEKMSGVYYPYWMYDCRMRGGVSGEATRVRVWMAGDEEFTETSVYRVERQGEIALEGMTKNALEASDKALVEGVLPFRTEEMQKFSMSCLSGFYAKKRDIEREALEPELRREAGEWARRLLRDSVQGYSTVRVNQDYMETEEENWQYLLLPVWVLTYAGKNGRTYYYAMNGQTGKVKGELPADRKKLGIFCGLLGTAVFLLCLLLGWLI